MMGEGEGEGETGEGEENIQMKPEEKARKSIDRLLEAAGWKVQYLRELNLGASKGVAVREFPLESGTADYLLFVDKKAAGVVEAKPEGTTLSGVAEQSQAYLIGVPENIPHVEEPLPFAYESTGVETFFRHLLDPETSFRRVFAFRKPGGPGCHMTMLFTRPIL